MKERAIKPFYSQHRREWIVGIHYDYAPGEEAARTHGHASFRTEDEALAFVAETNGRTQ